MRAKKVSIAREQKCGEDSNAPIPYNVCVKNNNLVSTNTYEEDQCVAEARDGGGDLIITGNDNNGALESTIYFESIGLYLTMLFGDAVTVDNGDGTFTHTFDSTKFCVPCWSVQNEWSNEDDCADPVVPFIQRFNGVRANTYAHSVAGKGLNSVSLGLIGGKYRDNVRDTTLIPLDTANQVIFDKTALDTNRATIKLDTDVVKLNKFDVNIDNMLEVSDLIGDVDDIYSKGLKISGSVGGIFDKALYTKVSGGNKVAIEIEYTDIAGENSIKYLFPRVTFEWKSSPVNYGERWLLDSNFTASRGKLDAHRIQVVLKNKIANYN